MHIVSVIEYSDKFKQDFKRLNYEWIESGFVVEHSDEYVLLNPNEAIILKGGFIYFAKLKNEIVGTCALIKTNEHTFEIAKMAVTEKYQSHGVGKKLMDAILKKAHSLELKKLILYSHTSLDKAIKMYIKYGFKEIPKVDFHNKRANIKMELILSNN